MKRPENPCKKDCPYRTETCHRECADYKRFKAEMKEFSEKVKREKIAYYLANRCRRQKREKLQKEWDGRWN